MRRPRCGTCRHWVNDEGPNSFCSRVPASPIAPGADNQPRSTHPIVPNWAGCAQHERALLRSLKAVWARLIGKPGNDPKRIGAAMAKAKGAQQPAPQAVQ